jgi:hypothetical protein
MEEELHSVADCLDVYFDDVSSGAPRDGHVTRAIWSTEVERRVGPGATDVMVFLRISSPQCCRYSCVCAETGQHPHAIRNLFVVTHGTQCTPVRTGNERRPQSSRRLYGWGWIDTRNYPTPKKCYLTLRHESAWRVEV